MELTPRQSRLRDNLQTIQGRIDMATSSAGRQASDVRLVAVTKYVDAEVALDLALAGCSDLGESRPQQLWDKVKAFGERQVTWHLIGHLQRNKVDRTVPLVSLIHSVDSERLLTAINAAAGDDEIRVLLEVNTSNEAEKHGFKAEELSALLASVEQWPKVQIRGLMTMAARGSAGDGARKSFAALRELRDQLSGSCPPSVELNELSMGMSGDFEEAILEGATIVRVGSALFDGIDD